jgi:hypothetical protein
MIKNPPQNGGNGDYTLLKIISKTKKELYLNALIYFYFFGNQDFFSLLCRKSTTKN